MGSIAVIKRRGALCYSRDHRLQIRLHHVLHAADLRVAPKLIHRTAARAPAFAQRFERDIEPDLVAVLEAVGHGFGRTIYPYPNAFDLMFFDAGGQRLAGEPHDAQRRVIHAWARGPAVHRHPYLMRDLGAQLMKPERGQQADYPVRHPFADLCQTVVRRNFSIGRDVEAAPGAREQPLATKPAQVFRVNSSRSQVADPEDPHLLNQLENLFCRC